MQAVPVASLQHRGSEPRWECDRLPASALPVEKAQLDHCTYALSSLTTIQRYQLSTLRFWPESRIPAERRKVLGGHSPFRTNISKNEAKSSSICDDTISYITELSLSQAHAAIAANPGPHSPGVAIVDPDFLHAGKVVLDWLEEQRDAFAILDIDT
jgi:hypothetical protein